MSRLTSIGPNSYQCVMYTLFGFLLFVSKVFSLPFIEDDQLRSILQTDVPFGVVPMTMQQANLKVDNSSTSAVAYLNEALPILQKYDLSLYALNCESSTAEICKSLEETQSLNLFNKNRHVIKLRIDEVSSHLEVEGRILHWLNTSFLLHVTSVKEWKSLMKSQNEKKNIVLTFSPDLGNKFHNAVLKAAISYKDQIQFAYITDKNLIEKLKLTDVLDHQGKMWISMCAEGIVEEKCITAQYLSHLTQSNLDRLFSVLHQPSVTRIESKTSRKEFDNLVNETTAAMMDVVIIAAGNSKQEKAYLIARKSCTLLLGNARCFFAIGNDESEWASNVANNRIHLSIIPHENDVDTIEVGSLFSELPEEVFQHWKRLEPLRRIKRSAAGIKFTDWLVDDPSEEKSVFEIQDDPVAHTVHYNKFLQDLYLFDFKSIPRLADVTYDDVINGDKYAVILFTMEFNPKSLATLSHFWLIHKEMKDGGEASPLHRVECFDWPDVCTKADVITYPKMFFYKGAGEERLRTEYAGIWSLNAMKEAIVFNSLSKPVEANVVIPDAVSQVVYGLIATDSGETVFKNVAEENENQCAFQLIRDASAIETLIAKTGLEWSGKDALMTRLNGTYSSSYEHFATTEDVKSFVSKSFQSDSLVELTIENYQQYLSSTLPLFIHFKDVEILALDADSEVTANVLQLSTILSDLHASKSYADKANIVWMDSSYDSPGEYLLHKYSNGKSPPVSLAFLSKTKTVSLKVFEESLIETDVKQWMDLCLSGNAPSTFEFLDDKRTARLEGHDYLRYIKEENGLPKARKIKVSKYFRKYIADDKQNSAATNEVPKHTEL